MNVEPGDLAVFVRTARDPRWLGRICRVIEWFDIVQGWITDPMPEGFIAVYDHSLRPIRDPGDDAKDEMLRPLPKKEIA